MMPIACRLSGLNHAARRLCLALAALMLLAWHAGALAGPIVVSARSHSDPLSPEFRFIKAQADAFNERQNTYQIEFAPSLRRDHANWVHREAANGTLPCLLDFDGPFLAEYAWPRYFQPIDKLVPKAMLDDFLPSIVAQGSYQGRLYSLGQFESGVVLWGNLRYLRAAGVRIPTLRAPWNLAEFEDALARLAKVEGLAHPISFAFFNGRGNEFFSYGYAPIVQGFGGDLIDRRHLHTAKGVLDGPQSVDAIAHLKRWYDLGWANRKEQPTDLATGKIALYWTGHWGYRPSLQALGKDLVLLPLPDFGQGIKTGMGSWNWGISSTCRHPEGAWAFLSQLLSTEAILGITDLNGAVPARRSALRRSPLYAAKGPLQLIVQQLELGGVARPTTPAYGRISTEFRRAVENIVLGADTQTELSNAADNIDKHIAANRGYPYP
jgi:multiple sugar transport system substrate-binding protein